MTNQGVSVKRAVKRMNMKQKQLHTREVYGISLHTIWYTFVARSCLSVKEHLWVRRLKVLQVKAKKKRFFFVVFFEKKKKKALQAREGKLTTNDRLTQSSKKSHLESWNPSYTGQPIFFYKLLEKVQDTI